MRLILKDGSKVDVNVPDGPSPDEAEEAMVVLWDAVPAGLEPALTTLYAAYCRFRNSTLVLYHISEGEVAVIDPLNRAYEEAVGAMPTLH